MPKIAIKDVSLSFGSKQILKNVSLEVEANTIVALIGPSGCGKSTLLRCVNRMHDMDDNAHITGVIELDGENISGKNVNVNMLRQRIGMVFQKPNPFPKSIRDNIAFGMKINGMYHKDNWDIKVKESLSGAFLWEEVKDKLDNSALDLSGGQQQRLCIARSLAVEPEVILMDEPTSALDPLATKKVEDLVLELKKNYTVLIVTHNMQQARRIADKIAMMYLGDLIEFTDTKNFFENPQHELAKKYVSGDFG